LQVFFNLKHPSSTVHNIIKRSKEPGDISVCRKSCEKRPSGAIHKCSLKLCHANKRPYVNEKQNPHQLSPKPASLMVRGCISACKSMLKGKYSFQSNIYVHSDDEALYFSNTMLSYTLHLFQQDGFLIEESRCWPDLSAHRTLFCCNLFYRFMRFTNHSILFFLNLNFSLRYKPFGIGRTV